MLGLLQVQDMHNLWPLECVSQVDVLTGHVSYLHVIVLEPGVAWEQILGAPPLWRPMACDLPIFMIRTLITSE